MKGNFIRFYDTVDVTPLDISDEVQDYYAQSGNVETTPLRVRIAATHSGKITRNNGFYLPHKMRDGTSTFTAQYPKPIQVHHDAKKDPIGRVIAAHYVDITSAVRDSAKLGKLQDSTEELRLLDSFVLGKMDMKDAVDFACSYFIDDFKVSGDPDYEGLGFIELTANITSPDAIPKVLDKRYLTGSTGASTNSAICSKCKVDWAVDGKCEHRPGKVYDGAKCVLIAGDLVYDEYSFVNKPADRHSSVIEVNVGGIQDFVQVENTAEDDTTKSDRIYEVVFVHDSKKPQEDQSMLFKDAFERISKNEFFKDVEGLEDAVKAILVADKDVDEGLERLVADKLGKVEDFDKAFPLKKEEETNTEDAASEDGTSDDASKAKADDATSSEEEVTLEDRVKNLEALLAEANKKPVEDDTSSNEPAACDKCKALEDKVAELTASLEDSKKDEGLQGRLDAARKEIRYLHQDIENLTSTVADAMAETRNVHVQRVVDFRVLSGDEVDFQTLSDELKDKSTDDILDMVKDISQKVDTKKIADTLNSGLSNNPTEEVENPAATTQDNVADAAAKSEKKELTGAQRNQLKLNYLQILRTNGETAAKQYMDACKEQGLLEG